MGTMPLPLAPGLFTVEDYHSFLETRPDDEGWQLIDGVAVMMTPPTLVHQRIGKNLCRRLDDILEVRYPQWSTLQEIGLIVPGYDHFRPKVDAAVVDNTVQYTSYSDRFYLVAEVLSESNTEKHIAVKRDRYQAHPDNLYVLVIDQMAHRIELTARADNWQLTVLEGPDTLLSLPAMAFTCRLSDLYKGTPLAVATPAKS